MNARTLDVLIYLAEHPRQLVTKDEMMQAVWQGSFVEESNLSQHIFLLRKALAAAGAADPMVVTVPARGYRFMAMVDALTQPAPDMPDGQMLLRSVRTTTRVVVEEDDPSPQPLALARGNRQKAPWYWAAGAAALLLLAVASLFVWRSGRAKPADHVDLVLAEMENTTTDPDFDRVLNQGLRIDLEQSPYLNLLSPSKVRETLIMMQRKGNETLTPEVAREICERNNDQVMLHSSISKFGGKYLLMLDADSCVTGQQIAAWKAEANSKEEVLGALDAAAARLRRQLGESAASMERFQTPTTQATTPSLEALRDFSQANDRLAISDQKSGIELLQHAIALDPGFASAYSALGTAYYNLQDFGQASLYHQKAFDLRQRTTEHERLVIEIAYHMSGDYDFEAAVRTLNLFNQLFPNEERSWGRLCNVYTQLGEYDRAVAAGEHAYRLDPHLPFASAVLARAYKRAGRFADAARVADAAVAEGKDNWGHHSILFQIAYARHDEARIKTEGEWGLSHQRMASALDDLALAAATSGKLSEALDEFARSRAEALRGGDNDLAEQVLADQAEAFLAYNDRGHAAEAVKSMKSDGGDPGKLHALQAETGHLSAARLFLAAEDAKNEKSTELLYANLPRLRAALALADHKPGEAIRLLEPARPYQLRDFFIPALRAKAESEAGLLDAAAQDYRLILDNQGVDPISPLYPLAHLRLARVLAKQKKPEEARQQYLAFFNAWKEADPNLPLLLAARSEFAMLR
jgi:Flp pilus assembly protein TadD